MNDSNAFVPGNEAELRGLQPLPIDVTLSTRPGLLDHATRNVVHAFADCVLVPVPSGVDADTVHVPLAPEALAPKFRAKLATHSIAAVLGSRSGGLFAIRFDDEDELAAFRARNPESRSTLITSHAGRAVVWHRTVVPHRVPLRLPRVTVLMTGNLLVLDRYGLGRADHIVQSAKPTTINIESIDWAADPTGAVDVWLTTVLEGGLFRPGEQGRLVPNRTIWRNYLARRLRSLLAYESLEHRFYRRSETNDWHPFAEDAVLPWLRELIMAAPAGIPSAKAALSDVWLGRLVRRLRSLLPAGALVLHARLKEYARACLKVERGSDVTVGELYCAFAVRCRENELPNVPEEVFQKHIAAVLRVEPWFRSKSKSVVRESGCQNGFRSLAFRRPVQIAV